MHIQKILATAITLLASLVVFAQGEKQFKGKGFSFTYPGDWQTMNSDGVLNFFPPDSSAAITISAHSNVKMSVADLKAAMVASTCKEAKGDKYVNVVNADNPLELNYECATKDTKFIAKVFLKNGELFFITANCDPKDWDKYGKKLMDIMYSFKLD